MPLLKSAASLCLSSWDRGASRSLVSIAVLFGGDVNGENKRQDDQADDASTNPQARRTFAAANASTPEMQSGRVSGTIVGQRPADPQRHVTSLQVVNFRTNPARPVAEEG